MLYFSKKKLGKKKIKRLLPKQIRPSQMPLLPPHFDDVTSQLKVAHYKNTNK